MDYQLLVNTIKQMLWEKFPDEKNKARLLSEILDITETAVYQKFNGNRQFSFREIARIARLFSVSIETLMGEEPNVFSHPVELIFTKDMTEEKQVSYIDETIRTIFAQVSETEYTQFTGICKNIPFIGYCHYDWLLKFAGMKWLYFHNCLQQIVPLTQMHCPNELIRITETYKKAFSSFRRMVFITDGDMIRNYILELRFFLKMGYITVEETMFLTDELEHLLHTAEQICRKGYTENPGQEIEIFYSDLSLHNDIYLVETPQMNQSIFFTQGFIPILHKEPQTFTIFREIAHSCVRSSNPICGVADMDRKAFFEKQHGCIEEFRKSLS